MGGDQVRDPGHLLVADEHEPGIVVEHPRDRVPAAPKPDELGSQMGHAVGDLLVPRRESVFGSNDQEPVALLRLAEEGSQGLCRLSRPRDREGRPGRNSREPSHIAQLLFGEVAGEPDSRQPRFQVVGGDRDGVLRCGIAFRRSLRLAQQIGGQGADFEPGAGDQSEPLEHRQKLVPGRREGPPWQGNLPCPFLG